MATWVQACHIPLSRAHHWTSQPMVFVDERRSSWILNKILASRINKVSDSTSGARNGVGQERDFIFLDSMEKGLAHELVTDFMCPLPQARQLWKFHIDRSEDKKQYRLFSDNGEFLLYAKASPKKRSVNFFTYDPENKECTLFDPDRPAFVMKCGAFTDEWRVIQERCDDCCYSPEYLPCMCCGGRREVACIQHTCEGVGDGISHCVDVCIACGDGAYNQDTWVESSCNGRFAVQRLVSKLPSWNDDLQSLVLDFTGRRVSPSSKNFLLAVEDDLDGVVFQHAKIGLHRFGLDFKYPLTAIQAFSIALTSLFWDC